MTDIDLRDVVIAKAKEAVALAGNATGYAFKAHLRGQFSVLVSKYPAMSTMRNLFFQVAGIQ